jgi:hypothetical protein
VKGKVLGLNKVVRLLVTMVLAMVVPAGLAIAQDPNNVPPAPGNTAPPLLAKPYEAVRDFFNYYALANVVYDTNGQYVSGGGAGSSAGVQLGGGVSGYHEWATAQFNLSYRGTYRDYFSNNYGSGNDQSLIAAYEKRYKHWTIDLNETAGLLYNQGSVYGGAAPSVSNPNITIQSNPFSTETRFSSSQISATYIHSYRLSFTGSGSYVLQRYNSGYSVGNNGSTGAFTTNYRLTKRTTLGGTYSHSLYQYQRGNGSNDVDSVYLTLSHNFANRIQLSASAGGSRSSGAGAVVFPVNVTINGQPEVLLTLVHYKTTNYLPYYALSASKQFRHTSVIFSGSESVTPGNGQYLTSRALNANALFVRELKRSNLSIGGYFARLNSVSSGYGSSAEDTRGVNFSYSYNLARHVGLNARYDYLNFGNYGSYAGRADNRLTFGVYLESKDVPLGLF